jgi:equilibrative nucleoside transporter 1/2/3
METRTAVERMRALFTATDTEQEYNRVEAVALLDEDEDVDVRRPILILPEDKDSGEPFSWFEYSIFLLLGVAMLWAW